MGTYRCRKECARRGFTLIELLVVVSIITLLISLLLPTIGEVRRQARISSCVQNMKQHATATMAYAVSNDDELMNGPKSPGGTGFGSILGPRGRTAMLMAANDYEVNGFAWGDQGMYTLTSPYGYEILNRRDLDQYSSMNDLYWVVLAQYMDDGLSGGAALVDTWFSPSDQVSRQDYDEFRRGLRDASGQFPETADAAAFIGFDLASPGSYRYVTAAMITPKVDARQPSGFYFGAYSAYHNQAFSGNFQTPTLGNNEGQFSHFIRRNRVSEVRYASQKVLFYMYQSWHNDDLNVWFQDGSDTPVALADGSARNTDPQSDMAPFNAREDSGAPVIVEFEESDGDDVPTISQFRCPYYKTAGGIKGRDLR